MNKLHLFIAPDGESGVHRYHPCAETFISSFFFQSYIFIKSQAIACMLLLLTTCLALIWASIPAIEHYYHALMSLESGIHASHFSLTKQLKSWVNDSLLTLFFFFLGLKIKRKYLTGELADKKCMLLVFTAAIGGMLMPGLIYFVINAHTAFQSAWSIPLTTNTAFVLGILSLFRRKLPSGLFAFMAGHAIIDNILAISIVAMISGIGFTMALFISTLSFDESSYELALVKVSIILASLIYAAIGIYLLKGVKQKTIQT